MLTLGHQAVLGESHPRHESDLATTAETATATDRIDVDAQGLRAACSRGVPAGQTDPRSPGGSEDDLGGRISSPAICEGSLLRQRPGAGGYRDGGRARLQPSAPAGAGSR